MIVNRIEISPTRSPELERLSELFGEIVMEAGKRRKGREQIKGDKTDGRLA